MALTVDMLRLTADPRAADELELSTWNGMLGSQHPSGRWWTYSTPMDGVREASAHSIVFQARAGTPELNCCSVNGPRVLGMLSEWTVMRDAEGLAVNFYAPGLADSRLADGTRVTLKTDTEYPRTGEVKLRIEPERRTRFRLRLRIPAWEVHAAALLNGNAVAGVTYGRYLEIEREWKRGDTVTLRFTLPLRVANGDGDALGRISLYRGPVLLTYEPVLTAFLCTAGQAVMRYRVRDNLCVTARPTLSKRVRRCR